MPFDSLFSARGFAHRKTTIVQKSGAGSDFCEYAFRFRPNAKFAFGEFWPDLRDKPRTAVEVYNPEPIFSEVGFFPASDF